MNLSVALKKRAVDEGGLPPFRSKGRQRHSEVLRQYFSQIGRRILGRVHAFRGSSVPESATLPIDHAFTAAHEFETISPSFSLSNHSRWDSGSRASARSPAPSIRDRKKIKGNPNHTFVARCALLRKAITAMTQAVQVGRSSSTGTSSKAKVGSNSQWKPSAHIVRTIAMTSMT